MTVIKNLGRHTSAPPGGMVVVSGDLDNVAMAPGRVPASLTALSVEQYRSGLVSLSLPCWLRQMPSRRGDAILHLLSPPKVICFAFCLLSWRASMPCTVASFCLPLLDSVLRYFIWANQVSPYLLPFSKRCIDHSSVSVTQFCFNHELIN
jgi:hypothetical protein